MDGIVAYLNFNGNGSEALDFYEKALEGKILFKQTFGESPMADQVPAEMKNGLMHASFQCEMGSFMASDAPPGAEFKVGNNISLSLHFTDGGKLDKTFNALSEGGTVVMAPQETFWAAKFGMLVDKYGVNWLFNMDKPQG